IRDYKVTGVQTCALPISREPYLDYRLVEFLARVPPRLKLKYGLRKKYLLKASMQGKLPRTIVHRKKQGFNVPNAKWIKRELKPRSEERRVGKERRDQDRS